MCTLHGKKKERKKIDKRITKHKLKLIQFKNKRDRLLKQKRFITNNDKNDKYGSAERIIRRF